MSEELDWGGAFLQLCKENETNLAALSLRAELSYATLHNINRRGSAPSVRVLNAVARAIDNCDAEYIELLAVTIAKEGRAKWGLGNDSSK